MRLGSVRARLRLLLMLPGALRVGWCAFPDFMGERFYLERGFCRFLRIQPIQ